MALIPASIELVADIAIVSKLRKMLPAIGSMMPSIITRQWLQKNTSLLFKELLTI
jgi:hypothetical protein